MKLISTFLLMIGLYASAASEKLMLSSPLNYQVVQRTTSREGPLRVQGTTTVVAEKWQYRLVDKSLAGEVDQGWHDFPSPVRDGAFDFTFKAPAGGWYRLDVRGINNSKTTIETSVPHVGIGEVFIIAGQSNAGNYGSEKQMTKTGNVSSFNGNGWNLANDPQQGSEGEGGSFIPSFGDAMNEKFHVPIGIAAIAAGGTSVRQWLPKGSRVSLQPTTGGMTPAGKGEWESTGALFDRLANRIDYFGVHGFRAVLWHQGESDAGQARSGFPADRQITGAQYIEFMRKLIHASRALAAWPLPWFTAQATYHSEKDSSDEEFRTSMKRLWEKGYSLEGPDTDQLREEYRAGVHFKSTGLQKHGQMWADKVGTWLEKQIIAEKSPDSTVQITGDRATNPRPASPEQMQWWRDAKFGLFIHWGPSSISGAEISWGRKDRIEGGEIYQKVPGDVYDNLYKQFNPVKFNAGQWMKLAKDAGFKYVVFITKHHDGFSMWPTGQVRWNDSIHPKYYSIADTPFRRDICQEIYDAAKKYGLKLGWYYSTRDWTHPDYLKGDNRIYNKYYEAQVSELLTRYGKVDMMWYDHTFGDWNQYTIENLFRNMYKAQPDLLVNNRSARGLKNIPAGAMSQMTEGDYDTPEQQIGHFQTNRAWESCVTMTTPRHDTGGWSYRPGEPTRSYKECIKMLVSTVTGDGNLLLNVGPMPTGEIQPEQIEVLKKMGAWLKKYGNSIYGTRGGPFINGKWGGSTYKRDKIWLHIFEWTGDSLKLPVLGTKVLSARTLSGAGPKFVQYSNGLIIKLPKANQDTIITVIELTLATVKNQ
jgi:alpha-L-fucosidase